MHRMLRCCREAVRHGTVLACQVAVPCRTCTLTATHLQLGGMWRCLPWTGRCPGAARARPCPSLSCQQLTGRVARARPCPSLSCQAAGQQPPVGTLLQSVLPTGRAAATSGHPAPGPVSSNVGASAPLHGNLPTPPPCRVQEQRSQPLLSQQQFVPHCRNLVGCKVYNDPCFHPCHLAGSLGAPAAVQPSHPCSPATLVLCFPMVLFVATCRNLKGWSHSAALSAYTH